jgi:hypothetical protein
MPLQDVVIAAALGLAIAFSFSYMQLRVPHPSFLLAGAVLLWLAAGYEAYMHFVWEPTVHAPIRLDFFIVDLPLMGAGVLAGLCSVIRRTRAG